MPKNEVPWLYSGSEIQFLPEDLIQTDTVVRIIADCVKKKVPLSLIRIGDGELSVMAQNIVLPTEFLKKSAAWNSPKYCGISLKQDFENHYSMRDKCIEAVKNADLVGVFPNEEFTSRVFSAIGFRPKQVFYAFGNVYFCFIQEFIDLLISDPPLLVGKQAADFANYLEKTLGVQAAGIYTGINSPEDLEQTIDYMAHYPHDWSLVSAGVNADLIAPVMAREYGKVCIDYGHAMDVLINPKYNGRYYFLGHKA
ncbi:hypothetical protein OBV_12010 [Oscillibacter valericigenes Sjm18-20]|nr:hypothetical protein OBV_12010 [Oscillibacter valericigenes Sjm18-20]